MGWISLTGHAPEPRPHSKRLSGAVFGRVWTRHRASGQLRLAGTELRGPGGSSPRVPSSPRRTGRGGTICQTECSTLRTAFQESIKMIRVPTVFLMFAGGVAVLSLSYANAQSPNPALIAPGSSGAGLAPPTPSAPSPQPRSSAPDPAPGGNTVQAPSGTTPTQGAPSTSVSSSGSPSKK
jgi:hypothetical protein